MPREFVNYEIGEGIAIATINRPPANAMNAPMMAELGEVFEELGKREDVGVVILTGAGRFFMAGAEIKDFIDMTNEAARVFISTIRKALNSIVDCDKAVIAAINGSALGGGCELAMCCDIRVADEKATFGQPEVNLSVIPGGGGTQRLARLIGMGRAKELIFTAKSIGAEEAKSIGLINEIAPSGQVMEQAKKMAKEILPRGPLAITAAKKAINQAWEKPLKEGLLAEEDAFASLAGTEDMKEGATAFFEKRKPVYKGR